MDKKKESNKELPFSEDYVWMSYRYCIGRHTIVSNMHAGMIANDVYGKIPDARMQFMSEDICRKIHDVLHCGNFIDMGWYGNIPKTHFKPIDVVYSIFDKESINTHEKARQIKSIAIDWNRKKNDFDYSIYYFNEDDKNKDFGRSLMDIEDLEVWQRLANLFDKSSHKWCQLVDGSVVEYYEYWRKTYDREGGKSYEKVKSPIGSHHNFSVCCFIPEENILKDNVDPI